jgi:hypothetical protein
MSETKYNKNSVASIYEHSVNLIGNSLSEVTVLPPDITNSKNRGDLGSLVEKYYFEHNPPNNHDPDFEKVGLELKTTGFVDYKRPTKFGEVIKAKERLFLTNINYKTISFESWETSSFLHKCNLMLILFYKYNKEVSVVDQKFVFKPLLLLVLEARVNLTQADESFVSMSALKIPTEDVETIKRDWEFIKQKVKEHNEHELSEGDTNYLAACRKGAGGKDEKLQRQSKGDVGAKSRAFAFKQSYLTKLLQGHSRREYLMGPNTKISLEEATQLKFAPFIGLTIDEIAAKLNYDSKSKSRKFLLTQHILSKDGKRVSEFEKAEIFIKTVSLTKSGKSREDISFPAFKYLEIDNQTWEESDFSYQIESRFLLVIFRLDEQGKDRLIKTKFWTMPHEHRLVAKSVWEDTKKRIRTDARDLPKMSESKIVHVRPHARNAQDLDETPQRTFLVKKSFWLNREYIAEVVN